MRDNSRRAAFVKKVHPTPLPGGTKARLAEAQRVFRGHKTSSRMSGAQQHDDLLAVHGRFNATVRTATGRTGAGTATRGTNGQGAPGRH